MGTGAADRASRSVDDPPDVVEATLEAPELTTFSGSLFERFRALAAVARTSISVIIRGETGTGKEVAARALHNLSGRGERRHVVPRRDRRASIDSASRAATRVAGA